MPRNELRKGKMFNSLAISPGSRLPRTQGTEQISTDPEGVVAASSPACGMQIRLAAPEPVDIKGERWV